MKKVLFTLGLLALLSGCAIITQPESQQAGVDNPQAWQARQAKLKDFTSWSLQGRIATGKLLGWTGNLSWRQRGDHFDVRLAGPLGAGGMRARGTLERVTIDTSDGKHLETSNPDALAKKSLGWSFPLKPLTHWAKGVPAPGGYQRISVDDEGRLRALTQDGWKLSYLEYTTPEGASTALPRRIVLENDETRVRLVIDRWFDLDVAGDGAG